MRTCSEFDENLSGVCLDADASMVPIDLACVKPCGVLSTRPLVLQLPQLLLLLHLLLLLRLLLCRSLNGGHC